MVMLAQEKPFYLKIYQAEFVDTRAKFPAIISAWGTGKDLSALARVMFLAKESEDNLILVLRKEFKDLQDSTINDFESYTGIKVNSDGDALIPTSGLPSKIMFRHIEQLNSLQNINLGAFWINQGEELPDDTAFQLLKGRLRRNVKRRTGFITANADGHNWCWKIWLEHKNTNSEYPCWEATTYDNADVLPEDYVKSLKDLPENLYKRFVLNDHSVAQGLVWPEFDENKHTSNSFEIPDAWKDIIGLDHGHNHPTAVLFGAVNYDGKLIIYDEHYEAGQLISYHAQAIKKLEPYYQSMKRWIDPSCRFKNMRDGDRCSSIIEAYQDYGISFRPATMDSQAAINKVGELFKKDEIIIFKDKCPNLIREIKEWKWEKPKSVNGFVKEEPIRLKEDACKALTYLVAGRLQATEIPKPRSKDKAIPLASELLESGNESKFSKFMK